MLIEGQRLGDFEILDHIGQGGMGAVFKARQISLERIVALKTLKPFVSDDPEYVARFHQEAVAAASLNHPNLVEVYEAGEAEGIHFFAMEFIDGESAQGRLERQESEGLDGRIEPLEAIAMATHVSMALDHGWRKAGLIHRDIKPDNIFLSTEGEVKLGDLGLAKSGGQSMATQTGAAIGTPHYISPEQAEGKRDIDLRADIYSLGCTLYHLLCGQTPYAAESAMAVMLKHVSAPVPDLRAAWPECPEELAALVGRMMQKAPADRFQSHAEVGAELRRVYDGLCGNSVPNAVGVAPDAATRRSGIQPGVLAKKSKVPLYAGIGGGILALAAAAFFVLQPKAESGRADSPKPPGVPGESALPMTAAAAPTPMATGATPSAAARSAAWQPLFTDAEWKRTTPGRREVVDGRLRLSGPGVTKPQTSADGAIRARIQYREGSKSTGLVARMGVDGTRYKLYVLGNSRVLMVAYLLPGSQGQNPQTLGEHPLPKPLQPGDTVLLELRLQGDRLTVLVDGAVVIEAQDSRVPGPGQWGIIADNGWFESVEVQTLPPAAPAVEPWQNLLADQSLMVTVAQAGSTMNGQSLELISYQNVLKRGEYRNGAVRLRAIFEDKRQCSVAVRKHDSQERYVAAVKDARTVDLSIVHEGKGTHLQSIKLPQPLVAGREYQLELRIVGSLLSVRFDGALLATQEDSTLPGPGQFGVWNPSDATQAIQGLEFLDLDTPAAGPTAQTASLASAATKDAPFVNTLGMKFAPVPIIGGPTAGKTVLFSIWDTRVQDYAVFATETKRGLPKPDFEQVPTHPQVTVDWENATAFCQWLTEREHKAGKLGANERYRLPSDHEWSCAVGIGEQEDAAKLPWEKTGKIADVFPWGTQWPPPKGAGNLAGEELSPVVAAGRDVFIKALLPGYNDGFLYTSPVGSFAANRFGLYDMAGNVTQWCEDWFSNNHKNRATRGSGWSYLKFEEMLSSARGNVAPTSNNRVIGFRCVLEAAPAAGWEDLLAKLTPELVAQTGHGWRLEAGALSSPVQNRGVVPLPGTFAGASYQARVKLRQLQPKGSFNFVLPVADRMVQFVMDGYPEDGWWTGLDLVNNKETKVLPGALHGRQFRDSEPHELEVTVRLDGANAKITVTLDVRPFYEWAGPTAALSLKPSWATTTPGSLALGTWTDDWVVSEVKAKRLDPALAAASTPASTPKAATPKPVTELEKWFAQVDGPQQEAYQKQAVQPFETGLAEMRTRYLASLDTAIAKASAAGQLAEALAFRTERRAFAEAQNVAADDTGVPPGVLAVRVAFRQQLVKLDQTRLARAKTLFAAYDAILDKYQSLLTQRQRLDEALLLKTKRDGIAGGWLAPSPLISAAAAVAAPEPAKATSPPPAVQDTGIRPAAATKENPFVNTLGMKFVPVPITHGPTAGKRMLVSIWDTRVQDYQAFADETKRDWPKPGFPLEPNHPAVMVTWDDAKEFCAWLTERERKAGKIAANEEYRLPSDQEWSCAVALPPEQGDTPAEKSGRNQVDFPWGRNFPPKKPLGNYAEQLYADGYVKTSPVGSFPPNRFGLFDMGGNVWQWCEDWLDATHRERALRGAAWNQYDRDPVLSSARGRSAPTARSEEKGFRCVLGVSAR